MEASTAAIWVQLDTLASESLGFLLLGSFWRYADVHCVETPNGFGRSSAPRRRSLCFDQNTSSLMAVVSALPVLHAVCHIMLVRSNEALFHWLNIAMCLRSWTFKTPYTRCNPLYSRLYNRLYNQENVCIHDTAGCTTGYTTGCTTGCIVYTDIFLLDQPVVQPVGWTM